MEFYFAFWLHECHAYPLTSLQGSIGRPRGSIVFMLPTQRSNTVEVGCKILSNTHGDSKYIVSLYEKSIFVMKVLHDDDDAAAAAAAKFLYTIFMCISDKLKI